MGALPEHPEAVAALLVPSDVAQDAPRVDIVGDDESGRFPSGGGDRFGPDEEYLHRSG